VPIVSVFVAGFLHSFLSAFHDVITMVMTLRKALHDGLKVRKFGNSLGVVLPKEVIKRLHSKDGAPLFLIEAPDGGYRLSSYDPDFEKKDERSAKVIVSFQPHVC
jgi:hypothetical protein